MRAKRRVSGWRGGCGASSERAEKNIHALVIRHGVRQLKRVALPHLTIQAGERQNRNQLIEHLSQQQVEGYRQQRLAAAELIGVDDHLAACAACRQRLEAALPATTVSLYSDWQAAAETLPAPHLTFEQIAAHIDETLSSTERQFVADHLVSCAQCAHAADDLRVFTDEAVKQPGRVAALTGQIDETGWWSKLRALLWPQAPAPAFALVLAALLVIALVGWLLTLKQRPSAELAGGKTNPTVTPSLAPLPVPSVVPEAAPLIARLNDGSGQITLDRQGKLSGLDDLPPAYQQMVKETLTTERLPQSASLAGLNRRASSLMGADEQGKRFSLTAPAGKVILTARPNFRWTQLSGATGYVVEIYDEQFSLVLKSAALSATEWTATQPLARGRLYAWQVKANKDGQEFQAPKPPAPQARFRVLDQAQAGEIARARRTYPAAHLTLALLYVRAGLLDEATPELRTLQKANPDAAVVHKLMASLQSLQR
jgi:hypothetical protein